MRLLLLLFLPVLVFGLEGKVQLEIAKDQEFFVSKKFKVLLKVMSTGFQISKLEVDYSANEDFVIIAPQSASYNVSEGEYSGVVYEYEAYPLKASKVQMKPWSVSFEASGGYGQQSKHFIKKTAARQLHIDSIKGHDFLLATPSMQVKTEFFPEKRSYKVGEALQRKTTIIAKEVVDLLIPSVKSYEIEGLQVYRDEPKLSQERDEKGTLLSKRVQTETYLILKAGDYAFDEQKIYWYNTQNKKVQSRSTSGLRFNVLALVGSGEKAKEKDVFNNLYPLAILGILIPLYLIYRYAKNTTTSKKAKKRARSLLVESINPKEEL